MRERGIGWMKVVWKVIFWVNVVGFVFQYWAWKSDLWWGMATLLMWGLLDFLLMGVLMTAWTSKRKTKILQKES